jgi:hypothetical protein
MTSKAHQLTQNPQVCRASALIGIEPTVAQIGRIAHVKQFLKQRRNVISGRSVSLRCLCRRWGWYPI